MGKPVTWRAGDAVEFSSIGNRMHVFRGVILGFVADMAIVRDTTGRRPRPVRVSRLRRGTITVEYGPPRKPKTPAA